MNSPGEYENNLSIQLSQRKHWHIVSNVYRGEKNVTESIYEVPYMWLSKLITPFKYFSLTLNLKKHKHIWEQHYKHTTANQE